MSKLRSQARRDEKSRVFLSVGAERALGKSDARGSVSQPKLDDIREYPERGVSLIQEQRRPGLPAVCRVLQYVLGACIAGGGKDRGRAAHEFVSLTELLAMGRRNVGQARRMFASAQDRRSAVGRGGSPEMTGNRE
eukprot:6180599-Pleurochrysis_carterae.AAC.1